jgi:hypothetical protein
MLAKIQETKSNLMIMAQEKLDELTKRTMMENEQLRMEISFQVSISLIAYGIRYANLLPLLFSFSSLDISDGEVLLVRGASPTVW